eukprot:1159035-Pelagomonas_calceolata.AAC.3
MLCGCHMVEAIASTQGERGRPMLLSGHTGRQQHQPWVRSNNINAAQWSYGRGNSINPGRKGVPNAPWEKGGANAQWSYGRIVV